MSLAPPTKQLGVAPPGIYAYQTDFVWTLPINPTWRLEGAAQINNGVMGVHSTAVGTPPIKYTMKAVLIEIPQEDVNRDGGCSIINLSYENGIATYCCGTPITKGTDVICPEGMDNFQIPTGHALTGVALLSNVSSSSATASPSFTDTATRTCHGTAIGAGVGVPLGVIALMALVWALFERKARQAMRTQAPPTAVASDKGGPYVRSHNGSPSGYCIHATQLN
ncbi:hypothetical protein Aspvir_009313 [Aspergillus viridinutans]|uniref:Uncharacterized protein n=1 Tax=Aspergillus viridinutans TaxID=75553 RepID=A0A9P3BZS9_ASPVI|nr:uncharacterized protein Aspvir_009313 [Aspergillus viridinutans]GIK05209.1 hypothetical protein Aspvir_009313 [Aspergillus viridinutans]